MKEFINLKKGLRVLRLYFPNHQADLGGKYFYIATNEPRISRTLALEILKEVNIEYDLDEICLYKQHGHDYYGLLTGVHHRVLYFHMRRIRL